MKHERDVDEELTRKIREAVRKPTPIECIQPHEWDAIAMGTYKTRHYLNCPTCRIGYIARFGVKPDDDEARIV